MEKSPAQILEEQEARQLQDYIQFAKNSVSSKVFELNKNVSTKISQDQIRRMVEDPIKNADTLQAVSNALERKQGVYTRLIEYYSNALTYDYLISPLELEEDSDYEKIMKNYFKSATQLNKLNIKFHLPYFQYKRMLNGGIFVYKLEDSKGVVYKEIPNKICRVEQVENGVFRFAINVSKLDDKTIVEYPLEIQNLYATYKNSKKNRNKTEQLSDWQLVGENGFAFPTRYDTQITYPPLCYLFPELMEIEGIKELQLDFDKNDNVKMIHCKVPINKETGKPTMDKALVDAYKNAFQEHLPEGFIAIMNPFDTESISVKGGATAERRNLVTEAMDKTYANAGVSDLLFANKKSSSEALKKSIEVDMQKLYSATLPLFNNYLNFEIMKFKFQAIMLETSYFNREEKMKLARENMASGGSRLHFMALNGFNPLQSYNLLNFEQKVIKTDEFLVPMKMSYTLGGESESGRKDDVKTDNGEKSKEQR